MFSVRWDVGGFVLAAVLCVAGGVGAADVRMIDGTVYSNVTILRRDARTVEIRTQYGALPLPLSQVDRIDGLKVAATPAPTHSAPPAHAAPPKPSATPAADAPPASTPAAGLPPPAESVVPVPAAAPLTPAATPSPAPAGPPAPSDGAIWPYAAGLAALALGGLGFGLLRRRRSPAAAPGADGAEEFEFLDAEDQPIKVQDHAEASGLELARSVLQSALIDRASDVHVEPTGQEHRVRFRVDGLMQGRVTFPNERGVRLVTALKNLAQIDIAERRKAQDGRFGARSGGQPVDFRVATTPSVYGEKLVVRILDRKAGPRSLDDLGMSEEMRARFAETIHSRNGMVLVTGPTGSGKTSTLYAALAQIDAQRLNLVTVEDPVEYRLEGATQIPVNVRAGVTFESGLKSILRQDPDVILVGEMRDLEAAQIALRSSLTGHLVFSSLHARDAVGTVLRLEEMGIERSLVASSLFVVVAQRLVRVLCARCRVPEVCRGDELEALGYELPAGQTLYRPGGCEECGGAGYAGRTGVFELLVFDDELRGAINAGADEEALAAVARERGYRSYREDAARKVLLGITSVEEVMQAI